MPVRYARLTLPFLCVALTAGCFPLPVLKHFGAYSNSRLTGPATGSAAKTDPPPSTEFFFGIALSGGGSRAANFSAAVLWELHELGVLQHAQYISAVSGSALPSAYYALFKNDRTRWNELTLQATMAQRFEWWWFAYLLNPLRLIRLLGTSYDRSDVMAEVFNARVFADNTFGALKDNTPRLILNATNYITGEPFTFTQREFLERNSDLGRLPISVGVMASAAYPGGFRNITLKDFSKGSDTYVHLFDGGVSDNLGIEALLRIYDEHVKALGKEAFPKGCLLISVDAYTPYLKEDAATEPDTRGVKDVIIDSNALNAFSIFLQTKRRKTLESLGFDESNRRDAEAEGPNPRDRRRPISFLEHLRMDLIERRPNENKERWQLRELVMRKRGACKIWHIALTHIDLARVFPGLPELYMEDYVKSFQATLGKAYEEFGKSLLNIGTRFVVSRENAQELYTAARLLVRESNSRRIICRWLKAITTQECAPATPRASGG